MIKQIKSVGIWVRVSTEDQARGESPEHHEHRARCYAEAKGWHIAKIYRLDGLSGKSVLDYPQTKEMLADVKAGRITGLVFSKLARLARNTRELLELADIFNDCNADLISLHEAIDTSTSAGRLFFTILSAMAQWEREEIAERVAASVPIRAKLGKPLGGQACYGYQWKDGKLIPHPEEAPVRRLMYELYDKHQRKKTVARILNERGYRTRKGGKFSDTSIDRLLRDTTAKGLYVANSTRRKGNKWEFKPEEDWVRTEVPPIVSVDLWSSCNEILERQHRKLGPKGKRPVHLFSGLAFCECGRKMYVPSNSPKYTCSKCRTKIPIEDLEGIFIDTVAEDFFWSKERITEYLEEAHETLRESIKRLEQLREEQQNVQSQMDRLYNLVMDGAITSQQFAKRNAPLEERETQIAEEIPRLEADIDVLKIKTLSEEQIAIDGDMLTCQWPTMDFKNRRSIVENMVERVTIGDEISLDLRYFPNQERHGKKAMDRPWYGTVCPVV